MLSSEYYRDSAHPRRSAKVRRVGGEALHMTRIRQGAHGLDDPATPELLGQSCWARVAGPELLGQSCWSVWSWGGATRGRWTWGDGWSETVARRAGDIGLTPVQCGGTFEVDGDHEILVLGFPLATLEARGLIVGDARPFGRLHDAYHRARAATWTRLRPIWGLTAGRIWRGFLPGFRAAACAAERGMLRRGEQFALQGLVSPIN